jgi:hypothetical protein
MQTTTSTTAMCGKRTARFMCTLPAGHKGPHGRSYRRQVRPTAAGFTDLPDTRTMVRCDYCGNLCRRTGISGHKQHCGGWRREYGGVRPPSSRATKAVQL